jgi:hypothetical protein
LPHAITVLSASGAHVERVPVEVTREQASLDVSGLAPGLYAVLLEGQDRLHSARFLIAR